MSPLAHLARRQDFHPDESNAVFTEDAAGESKSTSNLIKRHSVAVNISCSNLVSVLERGTLQRKIRARDKSMLSAPSLELTAA
jgi:hypothetical protein